MNTKNAEKYGLVITLPFSLTDSELVRLHELVTAKKELIRKALDTNQLDITPTDDAVSFPWWDQLPDFEKITAYTEFLTQLVTYAKRTTRDADRHGVNEKYELRSLLYRIGLGGKQYAHVRKILLAPLSGNSAWKTPPYKTTKQET